MLWEQGQKFTKYIKKFRNAWLESSVCFEAETWGQEMWTAEIAMFLFAMSFDNNDISVIYSRAA